jgi:superfamily II DNA/RNA helicase
MSQRQFTRGGGYGTSSYNKSSSFGGRSQSKGRQPKKAYINPSKFVQSAKAVTEDVYVPTNSFADFDVNVIIKQNLTSMKYESPSPIQDQAIPHALEGKDIVGIANTGTGKTAAFAIPLLNKLISDPTSKAIILAPTRELAEQIEQQCRLIGKNSRLEGALLIGGTAMGPQLRDLRSNPRIIIGTPGRIKDHIDRRSLDISDCNLVVLDEVDRMLDMGFIHDITEILSHTSNTRQSYYFSATLDARVKTIIDTFSKNPVQISVKSGETSENVDQNVVNYDHGHNKIDKLHDILINPDTTKAIIFDDTHRTVEKLSKDLVDRGFSADAIHGGKSQAQRQRVLRRFKNNEINVLVATDVAARGLDVSDITHVINYSLPQSYDDYVHRIGRTGRAGKVGYALTFVER